MNRLTIDVGAGDYAIIRYPKGFRVPAGLLDGEDDGLVSVTRTSAEMSIVCPTSRAPAGETTESGWRLLTVRGPLEFTLTGIMASLSGSLAAAGVALFALSTFDTDHVLVKEADLARAVAALREAGHQVYE